MQRKFWGECAPHPEYINIQSADRIYNTYKYDINKRAPWDSGVKLTVLSSNVPKKVIRVTLLRYTHASA